MAPPKPVTSKHQGFCPIPVPDVRLWRVMDIDKLRTILCDKGLWFSRLDQFGDPKEGVLPYGNLSLLTKYPLYARTWTQKEYSLVALRSYACCFHMNSATPPVSLWRYFGKSSPVAITTTVQRIRSQIPNVATGQGPIYMGQVEYIDHCKDVIPDGNLIYPAYAVQTKWKSEKEMRLLIHTCGTAASDNLYGESGPFGPLVEGVLANKSFSGKTELVGGHNGGTAIVLPVDPAGLIEHIVRGPGLKDSAWKEIVGMAKKAGVEDRVRGK